MGLIRKITGRKQKKEELRKAMEEEKKRLLREILLHAEHLAENMNFRLLLETEGAEVLFVEKVAVTDIRYPQEKKRNIFERICSWFRRIKNKGKKVL